MRFISIIITLILFSACSSKELNLNPKMRLRPSEAPLNLIHKHDDLSSEIKLNFELNYPDNIKLDKFKEEKKRLLKNAHILALKTVYLMGYTTPPIDVSDFRTAKCEAFKVKKMHLVCTDPDNPMAWIPQKSLIPLPEYYWTTRFHEDYLLNWSEKFGVYISFKSENTSDLELLPSESGQEFNFKISRITTKPNLKFPYFYLKILEQRNPTIDLSLAISYLATKKTDGFLAPITQLSPDFENLKRKNILLIKKSQSEDNLRKIKEVMVTNEFNRLNICPFNLNACDHPNGIDFKDVKKVHEYIYNQNVRNHIWGLILLAHTTIKHTPKTTEEKDIIKATIDMKSIMSSYRIMPVKTFKEMIEH
jgi:hypothetical protein